MSEAIRERLNTGAAALWASAFVLMGLIIVQVSSQGGAAAHASTAVAVEDMVVVTASSSNSEEVLVVLDQRDEVLYVYGLSGGRDLRLFDRSDLKELFMQANRGGGGR